MHIFASKVHDNLEWSRFRSSESCVHQPILIFHDIYNAFDADPSLLRGVFLDFSRASDKVWHEGLLCKVKCMGIDEILLKLVESFLRKKYESDVLNGKQLLGLMLKQVASKINTPSYIFSYLHQTFIWKSINTSIPHVVKDPNTSSEILDYDFTRISKQACRWKISFNPDPL